MELAGEGAATAVATRSHDVDFGAKVAVVGFDTVKAGAADGDDVGAVARGGDLLPFVSCGDDDEGVLAGDVADGVAPCGAALQAVAGAADVEDAGGVGVVRYAVDGQADGPAHGGDDVAFVAGALAHGAEGEEAGVPTDAGNASAVVAVCADDAGDFGAVPVGGSAGAGVGGVGVAAGLAVVAGGVEVVAGEEAAFEVNVVEVEAGVDEGDDDAGVAGGDAPCGFDVGGGGPFAVFERPLVGVGEQRSAGGGLVGGGVEGVVGEGVGLLGLEGVVGFGKFDVWALGKAAGEFVIR